MKILLTILLLITFSVGNDYEQYLKSESRAEVHIAKLIDGGYYDEASKMLKIALEKFPNNPTLYAYYGKTFYNTGDLENAKYNFMRSLKIDPTNELSSGFIELINTQQTAQENEYVEEVLDYLGNKGLDFLLIFLAFLGGEVIARKHSKCNVLNVELLVKSYSHNLSTASSKMQFVFKNFFIYFPFVCMFLSVLVLMILSLAFSIIILWLQLTGTIPVLYFMHDLNIITYNEILFLAFINFITIMGLLFFYKLYIKYKELDVTAVDISDKLQNLALSSQFKELRQCMSFLHKDQKKLDLILSYFVNDKALSIVTKMNENYMKR